jgi:hypothetical protein
LKEYDLGHELARKYHGKLAHAGRCAIDMPSAGEGDGRRGADLLKPDLGGIGRAISSGIPQGDHRIDSPRQIKLFVAHMPLLSAAGGQRRESRH